LATTGARRVDTSLTDVLPTAMWQHFRSSSCRQRARSRSVSTIVPETSEFSGVETGTRVRDSRRCVANHDMSRRLSRPLCERLASSQPLGAHVMKSFLALTLAAALVVACTKTEQPQADSTQPQPSAAQPASPPPAPPPESPPPAVTAPAPPAESARQTAPPQKSTAPVKPPTSS